MAYGDFCCSEFGDIYDVEHFINILKDDVHIIQELPPSVAKLKPFKKAPVSWSKVPIYQYIHLNDYDRTS